jgi:trehalose 6-phosphate phosphatase
MRHLFQCWHYVAAQVRSAPRVALFLDFDGTLTPLKRRPGEVRLDGAVRKALGVLARNPRFHVWIISCRRQADVRTRAGVRGIEYLGLHGWEDGPLCEVSLETKSSLMCVGAWMRALLAGSPHIWVEDKEHIVAMHYRDAPEADARRAQTMLKGVVAPFSRTLKIRSAKSCLEVVPLELEDKGVAVRRLIAPLRGRALPVYIGDDRGDEPAFAALAGGLTVHVGPSGRSHARYRLSSAAEVREFLHKLAHIDYEPQSLESLWWTSIRHGSKASRSLHATPPLRAGLNGSNGSRRHAAPAVRPGTWRTSVHNGRHL